MTSRPAASADEAASTEPRLASSEYQRTTTSRVEKRTVATAATAKPTAGKCCGRRVSAASSVPATTMRTAPTASGHSSGSPRRATARLAATRGAAPTTTEARDEPASRMASRKRICESPGARSPASAKTASSRGRASSPVPGSSTAAAATTTKATPELTTAPSSALGSARSAKRSATVMPPKRSADASASRTAATPPPYSRRLSAFGRPSALFPDPERGQEDEHQGRRGEHPMQPDDRDREALLGRLGRSCTHLGHSPPAPLAQPDREHREAEQGDDREDDERDPRERLAVGSQVHDPEHEPRGREHEVAEDDRRTGLGARAPPPT